MPFMNVPTSRRPLHCRQLRALPSNLIQSELFGHERCLYGSQPTQDRQGRSRAGGTLFRRNRRPAIGDASQPAALPEDHLIQRIGSTKEITVDVRILAATTSTWKSREGRSFSRRPYHRLNVADIPSASSKGKQTSKCWPGSSSTSSPMKSLPGQGFSQEARLMQCHSWPAISGN
ncbi:hypothetical protein DSL92_04930 [Billgrantia gudaonensis]|uniref:Sigma-54 factor interaction domain-containing protein n=1 Tax=Billgrantia gudaonensis TaxID=376427 RepID=A0A432JJ96_9GAMM|nr:hypothetical protein DSL92_04930 [Halomonas gudaonensis]